MKTQIFAYMGYLGATTDIKNGVFLNVPTQPDQLGCVIPASEVEITQEAIDLIKRARREGGSFAEIMLTRHDDGSSSIGLFGKGKHLFGTDFMISKDCDLTVLQDATLVDKDPPQDFCDYIDSKDIE